MRKMLFSATILLLGATSLCAQNFSKLTGDPAVSEGRYSEGSSWGDINNDGYLDLFIPHLHTDKENVLFINNGDGSFTQVMTGPVVTNLGRSSGGSLADLDNDGDLDVYVTNDFNENNILYTNNGDGTFTRVTAGDLISDGGRSNGATWADYDNDGDLDLFVPNGQRPDIQNNILYRNVQESSNGWINIGCTGVISNTSAIGTKVRAKAAINGQSVWQLRQIACESGFNAQNSLNVEFGLGNATLVGSLILLWPSGHVDIYTNVATNQFYAATEDAGIEQIVTSVRQQGSSPPDDINLNQNYPNPFNPSTTIEYRVKTTGNVEISIYNPSGQKIRTLVNEMQTPGWQSAIWDGRDSAGKTLASGLYLYELRTGGREMYRKMLILR